MSLGNSLNMDEMLREGLTAYLRKLNCVAGMVLQRQQEDQTVQYKHIYVVPRRLRNTFSVETALQCIPQNIAPDVADMFHAQLPISGCASDDLIYMIMDLPEFGLLLLVKSTPEFEPSLVSMLSKLNMKFARSCISCLQNEQINVINDLLLKEIAERKQTENKYRNIIENAVEGIFLTALGGRFIEANQAMATIFGFETAEEMIDHYQDFHTQLYVDTSDRDGFIAQLQEHGWVQGYEARFFRKDGSICWGRMAARLARADDGHVTHIEGIFEDVTTQKTVEDALRQAKEEAETLNRMKSSFLTMVSHELRTPMTSVLGFAKLVRKQLRQNLVPALNNPQATKIANRLEQNLSIIVVESERLGELINDVLDLARLESGRMNWHMNQVDIKEILEHSLNAVSVLFREKNLPTRLDVPNTLPPAMADRDRIIQVVINLLSNAAKFTVAGCVTLRAFVEGNTMVVEVTDTGVGIPEEELDAIFQDFKQLGDTLTDKPRGTGLGLPICRRIIRWHGGTMKVHSTVGQGSTFTFTLPLADHEVLDRR
ncbi:PAS domain-containing sensor histidine kinase [Desulfovibrio inopinatus]|uniref:PAS domain-containing sensor histidine kinase n=1 Tax=Desulfovibrio inopinatus TaxID=102109 RepID=UPI00146F9E1C|nr:PAS domain-containing sensor histidine kinase [Desulfovibrio inopinatus]